MANPMHTPFLRSISICTLLLLLPLGAGCRMKGPDPFEDVNRFFYDVNEGLDRFVLKPASRGYEKALPGFVRTGIGNAFHNLAYGNVILNDVLQLRFASALGGVGRVAVNTTVGLAGTVDVATNWGLPAHQNDLGITLGRYGFKAGPYLVFPLFGPSTVRDAPNLITSRFVHPLTYIELRPVFSIPLTAAEILSARSRADPAIRFRTEAAIDPYIFTREAYLQRRLTQIAEELAAPPDDDFYDLDMSPTTPP
jgi:phospholipid-binding lipoprotein MlaA